MAEIVSIRVSHIRQNMTYKDGFPILLSIDVPESKGERRCNGTPGFRIHINLRTSKL